jgi:hypothetical protein
MKAQNIFTVAAIAATLLLPACASTPKGSDVKVSHEVLSGTESSGNYVERVTEKGTNYSKTTIVTHSVTTQNIPDSTAINPHVTTHTVKETNVRKVTKDGKTKVEKSSTETHSVTPVAPATTTAPAADAQ